MNLLILKIVASRFAMRIFSEVMFINVKFSLARKRVVPPLNEL